MLQRWVSPDPLAIHAPGQADFNLYAYVSGMALKATDPVGLDCDPGAGQSCGGNQSVAESSYDPNVGGFEGGVQQTAAPAPAPVAQPSGDRRPAMVSPAHPTGPGTEDPLGVKIETPRFQVSPEVSPLESLATASPGGARSEFVFPVEEGMKREIYVLMSGSGGPYSGERREQAGGTLAATGVLTLGAMLTPGPEDDMALLSAGAATEAREFEVVNYADKAAGFENHHGVLDRWAAENVPGYRSRAGDSPTIRLSEPGHGATKKVYRDWLREQTGRPVGGRVDWGSVSPREAQQLTERMFDAAKCPKAHATNIIVRSISTSTVSNDGNRIRAVVEGCRQNCSGVRW
jgi:HNH/Endo VII superfamily toxin with a SHH signature